MYNREGNMSISGKKVLFFGDSITAAANSYADMVGTKGGCTVIKKGRVNSPIAQTVNELAPSFYERYQSEVINNGQVPDVIIIFGGVNDYSQGAIIGSSGEFSGTTVYGAIKTMIYNIQVKFPNARIVFLTPLLSSWESTAYDYTSNGKGDLRAYRAAIKEAAAFYGCYTLDIYLLTNMNPFNGYTQEALYLGPAGYDGVHPNATGHDRIATVVTNFLNTII